VGLIPPPRPLPSGRVLVVGTTPDYVEEIRRRAPGEALFLTDPVLRRGASEPPPPPEEEILCDLRDPSGVEAALEERLAPPGPGRPAERPAGLTCFDCESLDLAARLAERLGLPFPSPEAVRRCRDKELSKRLWREAGLPCPAARRVPTAEALEAFRAERGGAVVLKPLRGSGGELVLLCDGPRACRAGHARILRGLRRRPELGSEGGAAPPEEGILAEEAVRGVEHSCDFEVRGGRVRLLRLTRKIPLSGGPFGGTEGYLLIPRLPGAAGPALPAVLRRCAAALGVDGAVCMLDFFLRGEEILPLELAPRPGGDCLPPLLRRARGEDPLLWALDCARGRPVRPEGEPGGGTAGFPGLGAGGGGGGAFLGLRLLARRAGRLRRVDGAALERDPRVLEVRWIRGPGHRIDLPPEDVDSWVLGWAVARVGGPGPGSGEPDPAAALAAELGRAWSAEIEALPAEEAGEAGRGGHRGLPGGSAAEGEEEGERPGEESG